MPDPTPLARDLLPKLKVRSFRAFRDEASIELRPLTLLYGHNQAGKSSLLRLVSLLGDSLRPGATPLDLRSPSLRGASFKELGWMGREPALSPRLTIIAPSAAAAIEPTLTLQYTDDGGLVVNEVKLIRGPTGDKFVVSLDGDIRRTSDSINARYAGKYRGSEWSGLLSFPRLVPDGLPDEAALIASEVLAALKPLNQGQWLHANRLGNGDGTRETRRARCCFSDGSDLAEVLRDSRYRSVLDSASAWIAGQEGLPNEVAIRLDPSSQPRFVLGHQGREHLPLHLALL